MGSYKTNILLGDEPGTKYRLDIPRETDAYTIIFAYNGNEKRVVGDVGGSGMCDVLGKRVMTKSLDKKSGTNQNLQINLYFSFNKDSAFFDNKKTRAK